jgi:hypothetical protein
MGSIGGFNRVGTEALPVSSEFYIEVDSRQFKVKTFIALM